MRGLRGRFAVLTFLRWLPIGLQLPVMVLLGDSRGLTLATIGIVYLAYTVHLRGAGTADRRARRRGRAPGRARRLRVAVRRLGRGHGGGTDTVLSVQSLLQKGGGAVANVALPVLVTGASFQVAWLGVGTLLALTALLAVGLPRGARVATLR